ncbi:glycosyltransferase family 4 protein [Rufibacter psychrotolerans]|uniref:glycosyltransferase family 4 protein n=1 Tax=Rufibacter psychrotolerans TaxID=2812556 RepID=UPI0019681656|nr:glycosyltransferase family 4 protein [Rufibacter sp. SYSU D00308]
MKVAYISRSTLFSSPGGDTKQIELTAHYMRQLGVQVDIKLSNEPVDYQQYDLLHFFNIIRPADLLHHAEASGKPFVISTIFLDYGGYEKKNREGLGRFLNTFFSEDSIEYLKVIARFLKNGEKIISPSYLWHGHRKSVKRLIRQAKVLLPNSLNEYRRLVDKYRMENTCMVIPNAIDPAMYYSTTKVLEEYKDTVICVARIEGRKNQLNLVRAMKDAPYQLVILGLPSPNNIGYYNRCKAEATANVKFVSRVSEEELYQMFNSAKVHVLPSFFETTGLASLEAAVMGCNVVITDKGDTEEYFEDYAFYCNPEDPASIRAAIDQAMAAPFTEGLRQKILNNYTWEITAAKTLEAYKLALQQ